jgi:hypothetical protein
MIGRRHRPLGGRRVGNWVEHACKLGLEGIASKRVGMPYRPEAIKELVEDQKPKASAMMRIQKAFERERMR